MADHFSHTAELGLEPDSIEAVLFAAQHLKMTRLALIPFGFEVRDIA